MNNGCMKAQWHCGRQETSDRYRKNWMGQLQMEKKKDRWKEELPRPWKMENEWQTLEEMNQTMAGGKMTVRWSRTEQFM